MNIIYVSDYRYKKSIKHDKEFPIPYKLARRMPFKEYINYFVEQELSSTDQALLKRITVTNILTKYYHL
jgi:hypothetical protein